MARHKLAALLAAAAALPAPAAAEDCVSKLERSLQTGKQAFFSCFKPGASWLDHTGWRRGDEGLQAGIRSLLDERPSVPETGLRRIYASNTQTLLLLGATSDTPFFGVTPSVFVVHVKAGGWGDFRVYRAGQAWPKSPQDPGTEPTDDAVRDAMRGLRMLLREERLPAWKKHWTKDGAYLAIDGETYRGEAIREYLLSRHVEREFRLERAHRALDQGGIAAEGVLKFRCRGGGPRSSIPILLLVRIRDGKLATVYEALGVYDDGCGF